MRRRRRIRILRADIGSTARIDDNLDALRAMAHVTYETVPDTTHFLPLERPELVRAAIERVRVSSAER